MRPRIPNRFKQEGYEELIRISWKPHLARLAEADSSRSQFVRERIAARCVLSSWRIHQPERFAFGGIRTSSWPDRCQRALIFLLDYNPVPG